jgi:hypothetical protein
MQVPKRTTLSRFLFAFLTVPVVSCTQTAAVQSASAPPPAVQSRPSYCKISTLDGSQLMQSIEKLIVHGDLTDVTFIETILRTKFSLGYGTKLDGSVDKQTLIYRTDYIQGSPIQATLYLNYNKEKQLKYDEIALLTFDNRYFPSPYVSYIQDCLQISTTDFYSIFGNSFSLGIGTDGSSEAGGTQQQGDPGKNGTILYLNIGYDINTKIIDHVSIVVRP